MYLNNNQWSASVLNVKIRSVCLKRRWAQGANSGIIHRSFKNKMALYSPNFGNKLQMIVGMGKECGFTSNFDMPRSFTPRKSELRSKMANSQSDCRTASCFPEKR